MKTRTKSLLKIAGVFAALTMLSAPSFALDLLPTDAQYIIPNDEKNNGILDELPIESNKRLYLRVPLEGVVASEVTEATLALYMTDPPGDGYSFSFYVLEDNAQYATNTLTETTWNTLDITRLNAPDGGMFGTASSGANDGNPFNVPESNDLCTLVGTYTFPSNNAADLTGQYIEIPLILSNLKAALEADSNGEITLLTSSDGGNEPYFASPFNTLGNPKPILNIQDGNADTTPPDSPTNVVVASARDGVIKLEWNAVTAFDLAGYRVYRSVPGISFVGIPPIAEVTDGTSFTDSGLDPTKTYSYVVTSFDTTGNENVVIEITPVDATPALDTTAPDAPTGLSGVPGDQSVALWWDASTDPNLAGYNVYRSETQGGTGTKLNSSLITDTSYIDMNMILNGQTYYYTVTAEDDAITPNESDFSAEVAVTAGLNNVPEGTTLFGSGFEGYGDFVTSPVTDDETWALTGSSVHYSHETTTAHTSSLLKSYDITRTEGTGYKIEGVVTLTDGYGDDNNRMGIMLFNDTDSQTSDGGGGLYLRLNTDDGKDIAIMDGVNGKNSDTQTTLASKSTGVGEGDSWIGQTLTYTADILYTNAPDGTNYLDVSFTMANSTSNTWSCSAMVVASNYTGSYFGFTAKWRNRGSASSNRDVPPDFDYTSFQLVQTATGGVVQTGYEAWAADNGITGAPGDEYADGLSNLRAYAFGATSTVDPTLPVFSKSGSGFTYVYPELADANAGITYTVQYTTDLVNGTWTDLPQGSVENGSPLNTVTVDVDTVQDAKFIRVKVTKP